MPPISHLWRATTTGEKLLIIGAMISYVAFLAAVVRAVLYHEFALVITLGLVNSVLTGVLTRSLLAPKGEGF